MPIYQDMPAKHFVILVLVVIALAGATVFGAAAMAPAFGGGSSGYVLLPVVMAVALAVRLSLRSRG